MKIMFYFKRKSEKNLHSNAHAHTHIHTHTHTHTHLNDGLLVNDNARDGQCHISRCGLQHAHGVVVVDVCKRHVVHLENLHTNIFK